MKNPFFIEYRNGDSLEMPGGNLSTVIATFGGGYARELFGVFMTFYPFLIISVHKILYFMHFSQKRDIPTNGWTD